MKHFSYNLSGFDTELFGYKVAKIDAIHSPANIPLLISDLKKNEIMYATFRLPAHEFPMIHGLEQSGFLLVDGLISLKLKYAEQVRGGCCMDDTSFFEDNQDYSIIEATEKDLNTLMDIARNSFFFNRPYNDPFIPKEKADELYARWIENSVKGKVADSVLVYKEKDTILGFITMQKKGHIPLIAVDKEKRGKGIAKKLLNAALQKIEEWFVEEVEIETQIQNIPALRAYQASGFKISGSYLTFRWLNK